MNYFDWEFYVSRYKDLKANGITNKEKAIWHYKNYGKNEGRYCNKNEINYKERSNDLITCTSKEELIKNIKYWNWKAYKNNHPDLKNLLNQELLKHLLNFGFKENREIIIDKKNLTPIDNSSLIYNSNLLLPIDFDWKQYLNLNKDLEDKNLDEIQCKLHYILYGNLEERNYKSINIIGFKFLNVSISENMFLLKKYIKKNNKFSITIYDISELDKINLNIQTIFCIQPFEITKIIPLLSNFKIKPEVLWVWEFKSLPKIFKEYEKYFSKIYVPSQFCYTIFSKQLSIPIEKVKLKSMIHDYVDKIDNHIIKNEKINKILETTKDKTIYGFCFDINSSIIRKNPLNLVRAFNNLNDDTKVLILKYRPIRENRFINKIENDIYNTFITDANKNSNIYCITDELEPLDLYKLYTNFDYYITPHCGEGFGLTIYDNMILGNKIISPYYSGETEYLNRGEIIELEYEEKDISGLRNHPIYGQMNDFKVPYISVESIEKCLINKIDDEIYILGNGPSLKNVDFQSIKYKTTFALNSSYKKFAELDFYPTYFGCFDPKLIECHYDKFVELMNNNNNKIKKFFFLNENNKRQKQFSSQDENNYRYQKINFLPPQESYINTSSFDKFYKMNNSGATAALISIILGYKKIILLGCDGNYVEQISEAKLIDDSTKTLQILETPEKNPNYWFDNYQEKGEIYSIPDGNSCHMKGWELLYQASKIHNVEIINNNPESKIPYLKKRDSNIIITYSNKKFQNNLLRFLNSIEYNDIDYVYVFYSNFCDSDIERYKTISSKVVLIEMEMKKYDIDTYCFKQKIINYLIYSLNKQGNILYCDTSIQLNETKYIFEIINKEHLFLLDLSYIGDYFKRLGLINYINNTFIDKYIIQDKYTDEEKKKILNHDIIIGTIYGFSTKNKLFIDKLLDYNKSDYSDILNFQKFLKEPIDSQYKKFIKNKSLIYQGSRHEQSYLTYLVSIYKYKYYKGIDFIQEIKSINSQKNLNSKEIDLYWGKKNNSKKIILSRNDTYLSKQIKMTGILLGNAYNLNDIDYYEVLRNKLFFSIALNSSYRYFKPLNIYPTIYCNFDTALYETHYNELIELIESRKIFKIYLLDHFKSNTNKIYDNVVYISNKDILDFSNKVNTSFNTGVYSLYILFEYYKQGYLSDIFIAGIDGMYVELLKESKILDRQETDMCRKLIINENVENNPNYFFNDYQLKGDIYHYPNSNNHSLSWNRINLFLKNENVTVNNLSVHSLVDSFKFYNYFENKENKLNINHIIKNNTIKYDIVKRYNSYIRFHYSNIIIIHNYFNNTIDIDLNIFKDEMILDIRIICFNMEDLNYLRKKFIHLASKLNIIYMKYNNLHELISGNNQLLPLHILSAGIYINVIYNNNTNILNEKEIIYRRSIINPDSQERYNLYYSNINFEKIKISFIIPTFNRFNYLKRCILSLLKHINNIKVEIIIIDDCSTDENYKDLNIKIKNLINNPNINVIIEKTKINTKIRYGKGLPGLVRNVGLRIAKGEYICFMDDDDFILELPYKSFDEYINYLFQNNIFIVSGETKRFPFSEKYDDSINESKNIQKFNTTKHCKYFCNKLKKNNLITNNEFPKYFTKEIIKIHNLITTSGIIINKNILNYVREFIHISYGEDWHYWQQILNFSDCLFDSNYIIGYQTDNVKQHEGKKS